MAHLHRISVFSPTYLIRPPHLIFTAVWSSASRYSMLSVILRYRHCRSPLQPNLPPSWHISSTVPLVIILSVSFRGCISYPAAGDVDHGSRVVGWILCVPNHHRQREGLAVVHPCQECRPPAHPSVSGRSGPPIPQQPRAQYEQHVGRDDVRGPSCTSTCLVLAMKPSEKRALARDYQRSPVCHHQRRRI